jgi:hypothetical protein
MNRDAPAKIIMFQASLRCFAFGLLALLPVIGVPFAFVALGYAGRARIRERQFWNPARPYRVWGTVCAAGGVIFWFLIAAMILFNAVSH